MTYDYESQDNIILVNKASEPIDILWKNLGVIESHYSFTRLAIFIVCLLAILFLSSPAVMLSRLQTIDPTEFLKFGWSNDFGWLSPYLQRSLPPTFVLLINALVLLLLDYASVMESYDSHSAYQASVYVKTVVYMSLNMFVIPVLTISGGSKTLYELLISTHWSIPRMLGELFIPKSGEFFIILLIEQGVLSAIFYALQIPEIAWAYFLPALAFEQRKIYNDSAPWRRHEQNGFMFGYFNAQMLTIFLICIFYAPSLPMISIASFIFVYMRHMVDSYNLLTFYRREIESSGKIIDYITNTALVIVVVYQICMTAYFAIHNRQMETIVCTIIFLLSVFYAAVTYEAVYDLARIEENMETIGEFDEVAFGKWKNEYAHPLVVGHIRRRDAS